MSFKTAIQRELDKFYKLTSDSEFNIRAVTKGAFYTARAKVDPYTFTRLNEIAVIVFYEDAPWCNCLVFSLLSCDGTRIRLPHHPTIKETFGEHKFEPKADSPKSLALCSTLYDPLNLITIDSQIDKYANSERYLLLKHLTNFVKKKFKKAIKAFDEIVFNTRELIRPGRQNPRNHKPKRDFHQNYKSILGA